MTEIKNAIDHYRDVCVQIGQYPESDTYRYAELAINSLNAWEEVLQELEESNWDWIPRDKAIELIKSKLEGVTE